MIGRNVICLATAVLAVLGVALPKTSYAQLRAFGEAEGFGAIATGARNAASPTIYHVTNLNDSGAGSFRDAVSGSNRIVVFDVGGYIHLASPVSAKSNLTILGQTASGDGIGIYGAEVSFFGQSNDIVRYVRFRDTTLDPGYKGTSSTSSSSSNCLNIGSSTNMIFDHVSCEFAPYNNIDAATAPNLTFQNSLVAAPIASQRFNFHWEGGGSASAGWGAGTFVTNVFVDGHNRSILAKGDTQFVSNTIYNYQAAFTSGNSAGTFRYDVVGNYFITGPSTTSASNDYYQVDSNQSAYATGNFRDSNNDGTLNGSGSNTLDSAIVLAAPWSSATTQLPQLGAAAAYAWNIAHAGVSIKHDPTTFAVTAGYDAVDAQMMNNVQTLGSAGRLWSSESQTGLTNGGLGTLNSGSAPTDTDHDGIPDTWEAAHGMNLNSAADALQLNPLGYRLIEQYANELVRTSTDSRTWSAASGAWSTAANWTGSTVPGLFEYTAVRGIGVTAGALTVSSGAATAMALSIGGNGPAAGEKVTVTGGTLNVYDTITVGDQNNATLQINGGAVQAYNVILGNTVYSPAATNYTGTLNLTGGTLSISQLVLGCGTPGNWSSGGSMNWSGGTLKALAQLKVNVPITVSSSGGTFDTGAFNGSVSGVISGVGGITKLGAGTLTLSGANTYTGSTKVIQGKLQLGAANVIGNSSNLALAGGTFSTGGFSDTLGMLIVTADSHLDLAAGASVLHFASSAGQAWSGTLTIDNWSGAAGGGGVDQIYLGANSSGLTPAQLAHVVFAGSSMPNSKLLPSGELVPGRTLVTGDFNHDNTISLADVQAMLTALIDLSTYKSTNSFSDNDLIAIGDLNGDGKLNNADIQGLLDLVAAAGLGATAAVPEPAAVFLAALGPLSLSLLRYSKVFRHRGL